MTAGNATETDPIRSGRWALITGASSGIGAAFARELSGDGYGVILVGRDGESLRSVAGQLPGPVRVLPADLADPTGTARVERFLADSPAAVSLVVNNAGIGYYGPFADQDPTLVDDMVAVNVLSTMRLTRAALPRMIEEGGGGVLNVSSHASDLPVRNLAAYAATKAFMDSWTRSLREEVAGQGVTVSCVRPGWTRTQFHRRAGQDVAGVADRQWQEPAVVARAALAAHQGGQVFVDVPPVAPGRVRRLARAVLRRLPPRLADALRPG
jgi:hypothetical protein